MAEITMIRHGCAEHKGFEINREKGHIDYIFLHFFNSVEILADGVKKVVPPNTCIIYSPKTPQWFRSELPLVHDWIHYSGDYGALVEKYGLHTDTLYYPSNSQFISAIVREMENEFFSGKYYSKKLLSLKTEELLIKLSRACIGEPGVLIDIGMTERMRKLRADLFYNLGNKKSVYDMAKAVNLSESRFFTVYKSLFGISPIDDMIRARIETAKNYLANTDEPIISISRKLGYSNITHFMRQFKKFTETTPGTFRAESRGGTPEKSE